MGSIINTNSLSLLTQNNLTKSQSSLTTAIQRLSSGLRINSAKDDAAGQAIANRFTSNIKGLTQASRNANDGISLAQTTEGALNEINNNLQRVRELTVQAKNGSNSQTDLDSIQSEIGQRLEEINRTSQQTDFNGTKVLGADAGILKIQVGANDNETIDIGLQAINTTTLSIASFNINGIGTANTAATASDLTGKAAYTTGPAANLAGSTTNSAWVQGATVAGTTAYTQTVVTKTTNDVAYSSTPRAAATSADVFAAVSGGQTTVKLGAGTGIDDYTVAGSGATAVFSSTTGAAAATTNASVSSSLVPLSGQTSAVVTIGTTAQAIKIDTTGNITDDTGIQLYLDTTGNLTQNSGGTLTAANIGGAVAGDLLKSMSASASVTDKIVMTTAGGSAITYTSDATAADDKWDFSNVLSQTDMQAKSAAAAGTVVNLDGGVSAVDNYSFVGTGAVSDGNSDLIFIDPAGASAAGKLSTTANTVVLASTGATSSVDETYYVHSNGNVMDNAGNNVYADSSQKGFTLNARTGNTSTASAMDVIDKALAKVDALRGSLGAVQNRFDSVISNLGSTITNLSASRSRIEDADYATEVSNMTRAQILQQAGTSVLSKANQSTQGVMSLLQ